MAFFSNWDVSVTLPRFTVRVIHVATDDAGLTMSRTLTVLYDTIHSAVCSVGSFTKLWVPLVNHTSILHLGCI